MEYFQKLIIGGGGRGEEVIRYTGVCDMFYDNNDCDIASYADDNTPHTSSNNLDALVDKLEESTNNLF